MGDQLHDLAGGQEDPNRPKLTSKRGFEPADA